MSCNYADGLSPYHDKGQLGLEERFDTKSVVSAKVALLTKWINEAKHVVVHTGAGISTSAGIPDFRGPRGVWTLQAKGEKPDLSTDFNDAIPTTTHMAITKLVERGKVKYVVSQNIDGLHLRSNLHRKFLSELHGNMFTEQCNACGRQFVRSSAVPTVGQKSLNKPCPTLKANGRPCRGRLHDTILDWEHNLPENDLGMADYHSCLADLSLCLGTTMQIVPSGNLPLYTKKHGGKLVICNLQPTKHNRKADLIIHAYVDEVMTQLMKNLNLKIPKYSVKNDPTKLVAQLPDKFLEWTISDYALKKMKKIYEEKCGTKEARKRLEMIDDDLPLSVAKNLKRTRVKDDDDSDLEVLDVIVKPKRSSARETSKRSQKKTGNASYSPTITVKKVTPPPKKGKYETEKITIKKNVTPTKTKYEIVQPKPKKTPKCEIVYSTDNNDVCNDLDMICESDDDEMTNNYTYNFRRYLYDEKELKKEEEDKKNVEKMEVTDGDEKSEVEVKSEVKREDENSTDKIEEVKVERKEPEETAVKEEGGEEEKEIQEKETEEDPLPQPPQPEEKVEERENTEPESKPEEQKSEKEVEEAEKSKTPEEELADYIKSAEMEAEKNESLSEELDVVIKEAEEKEVVGETAKTTEKPNEELDVAMKEVEENILNRELDVAIKEAEENRLNEELDVAIKEAEENKLTQELDTAIKKAEEGDKEGKSSEFSNLSSSNVENTIDELVSEQGETQFDNSLTMPECNITQSVTENFPFYNNEYNSSNNSAVLDYVDNNYYNNF